MLYTIIAFFSLAAILGMILLSYVLTNKDTPKGLAIIHGSFAAIGIVLLIVYNLYYTPKAIESLVLFIIAALGGFFLFYKDLTENKPPKWLAVVHGLVAVSGFAFLIIRAFLNFPVA